MFKYLSLFHRVASLILYSLASKSPLKAYLVMPLVGLPFGPMVARQNLIPVGLTEKEVGVSTVSAFFVKNQR